MLSINKVMLTGRLTRDPETKYMPSGNALTNLGIAVNRRFQDKNGEWRDETMFIDVETWGKLAERLAESLRKGQPVYVEGRLKQDTWERDGQKQTKIRVSADVVKAFDVPSKGQAGAEAAGESFEGDSYSEPSAAAPRSGASSAAGGRSSGAGRGRSGASTGAASDNLDFDDSGMKDDIPF